MPRTRYMREVARLGVPDVPALAPPPALFACWQRVAAGVPPPHPELASASVVVHPQAGRVSGAEAEVAAAPTPPTAPAGPAAAAAGPANAAIHPARNAAGKLPLARRVAAPPPYNAALMPAATSAGAPPVQSAPASPPAATPKSSPRPGTAQPIAPRAPQTAAQRQSVEPIIMMPPPQQRPPLHTASTQSAAEAPAGALVRIGSVEVRIASPANQATGATRPTAATHRATQLSRDMISTFGLRQG